MIAETPPPPGTGSLGPLGEPIPASILSRLKDIAGLGETMVALRQLALSRLDDLSLPSSNAELWRHTSLEMFPLGNLVLSSRPQISLENITTSGRALPQGVEWHDSFDSAGALIHEVIEDRGTELATDAVTQLILAATNGGGLLHVKPGSVISEPLKISQLLTADADAACPLIVVLVESGAKVTIVEDLIAPEFSGIYAPRIEVLVRPNASCEFVSVQRLAEDAVYLARHRFHLERDAQFRSVHVALGGAVARLDLDCKQYAPGVQAELNALYLARATQHIDLHTTQWHLAPHGHSNLYCKGAVTDRARAVYYGYIRVAEDAQKTDAYQKNRNLLLSPEARADAIPNLEIRANDVKCSHGASVGQVGADELFYLMSRGISRVAAERLLVEAFFEDLTAKISNEFVRHYVSEAVMERLRG